MPPHSAASAVVLIKARNLCLIIACLLLYACYRVNGLNSEIIIAIFSGTLLYCFISGKKDETPPLETARHSNPSVESFWQLYTEIQHDDVQKCVCSSSINSVRLHGSDFLKKVYYLFVGFFFFLSYNSPLHPNSSYYFILNTYYLFIYFLK